MIANTMMGLNEQHTHTHTHAHTQMDKVGPMGPPPHAGLNAGHIIGSGGRK